MIITRANEGIGKANALRLVKENTQLALMARNISKLNQVAKKLNNWERTALRLIPAISVTAMH